MAGTAGSIPTPATTKSQGTRAPLAVVTASTRPVPSNPATCSPASSSTPFALWIAPNTAPTSPPSTRSSGYWPGKMAVTCTPSWVSEAATSEPMKPMPTTTARWPGAAARLIASQSATVRR